MSLQFTPNISHHSKDNLSISNLQGFQTRQKTCVLVCKEWFEDIRGSGELSGQLFLENDEIEDADAEAILSKLKNLKILRLSKNLDQFWFLVAF